MKNNFVLKHKHQILIKVIFFIIFFGIQNSFSQKNDSISLFFNKIKNKTLSKNQNKAIHIYIYSSLGTDSINTTSDKIVLKLDSVHKNLIKKGFIYNKLTPEKIVETKKKINIYYVAKNLENQFIDTIFFVSKKLKFPSNIKKYLYKKYKGKKISDKNIFILEKDINNYTKNSFVKNIYPTINKKQTGLKVILKPLQKNSIDGIIGFRTKKNKLIYEGLLDLKLNNLFNINEDINIFWKKNDIRQELTSLVKFPFLRGTPIFILNETSFSNQENKIFQLYSDNNLGYNFNNLNVGIGFEFQKTIEPTKNTDEKFIGTSLSYNFNNKSKTLNKLGIYNYTYNEINFSLTTDSDFNIYSENHLSIKTKEHQYLYNSVFFSYSSINSIILKKQLKLLSYKFFKQENNINLQQIGLWSLKYIWIKKSINFYISGDLLLTGTQKKLFSSIKKDAQAGIGLIFLNKNQILTFEISNKIINTYNADNKGFNINIKQSINF